MHRSRESIRGVKSIPAGLKTMNLIFHIALYFLVISILLYASLAHNPRMWMHRMPPAVVRKVPPRTPAEKRCVYYWGVPFLVFLVVYPIAIVIQQGGGFWAHFWIFCAFFAGFAIWDTLVLDLLIFCRITPRFVIITGTERADYREVKYHLVSGMKGLVISIAFSALLAGLLAFVLL